jgi:hypothetical protein
VDGIDDKAVVGHRVGDPSMGVQLDGSRVGCLDGAIDGDTLGRTDGTPLGLLVGCRDGIWGLRDGCTVG